MLELEALHQNSKQDDDVAEKIIFGCLDMLDRTGRDAGRLDM